MSRMLIREEGLLCGEPPPSFLERFPFVFLTRGRAALTPLSGLPQGAAPGRPWRRRCRLPRS